MTKALITGIGGFAGSHLAEHLLEKGWEVTGIERGGVPLASLDGIAERISVEECDIVNTCDVARAFKKLAPDTVFHLAATSFIPSAENAPQTAFDVNARGSLNILDACRQHLPSAKIVLISSASVYGIVLPEMMPLREEYPPNPMDFYALTKLCAEEISRYYHRVHALPVTVLRPFNHIGPRQGQSFVTSSFAFQIVEIEQGKRDPILNVGNLSAARDFTDVRDMVRAYGLAVEKCSPGGVYNICSGRAHTIREILDRMLTLTAARIEIREDPERFRKVDVPLLYGDCTRFMGETGWKPERPLERTLEDILNYWRQQSSTNEKR
jgi:GDP-4-dehydro-6-deoxy-D-mannose reductase